MSFLNLSTGLVIGGIAALAVALYLLQQLRVRYKALKVPTVIFWQQAAQEAPVRVFRQRFRHILAYLLSLAIVSLLWLAFAEPNIEQQEKGDYKVLFLDGSGLMSQAGIFEQAVEALEQDLSSLPIASREVIWGGEFNTKLLEAGEQNILLKQRLTNLSPVAAPTSIDSQLRLLQSQNVGGKRIDVQVYGLASPSQQMLDELPGNIKVSRAVELSGSGDNTGITALGVAPAASGSWEHVDVLFTISSSEAREIKLEEANLSLSNAAIDSLQIEPKQPGTFVVRDVPAASGIFEVSLIDGGAISLDDVARITIPARPIIKVAVTDSVPQSVKRLLAVDPGLVLSTVDTADVVIRTQGEAVGDNLPALVLTDRAQDDAAFRLTYTGNQAAESVLKNSLISLGINQIDAVGLATALNQQLQIKVEAGSLRQVALWQVLASNQYNFSGSREYPVFLSQSIRWLKDTGPWYPYVQAGTPLTDQSSFSSLNLSDIIREQTLNSSLYLGQAGSHNIGDQSIEVSLTSAEVTTGQSAAEIPYVSATQGVLDSFNDLVSLLMIFALILLIAEWVIYQRGQMP